MVHFHKYSGYSKRKIVIISVLLLLTLFRFLLDVSTPVTAFTNQVFDDQMMFNYAKSLSSMDWLGVYDRNTLTKGISYPLFLVALNKFFIPYTIGKSLLNIFSVLVFIVALNKKIKNISVLIIIYLLLIYSPVNFSFWISQRTYRLAIIPGSVILLIGCTLGMYWSKEKNLKEIFPWVLGLGLSLSFFWFIREDSIWILPFITVSIVMCVLYALIFRKLSIYKSLIFIIPIVILITSSLIISSINYKNYGLFTNNDRSGSEFGHFMSNLYSIDGGHTHSDRVWVSKETFENVVKASSTLQSVQEPLWTFIKIWGGGNGEMPPGDIIAWAVRDGMVAAGYFKDAKRTNNFFMKVNKEISDGINNGSLRRDGLLHLSSQARGISLSALPYYFSKTGKLIKDITTFKDTGLKNDPAAAGDPNDVRWVETYLHSTVIHDNEDKNGRSEGERVSKYANFFVDIFKKTSKFLNFIYILSYVIFTIFMIKGVLSSKFYFFDVWIMVTGILLSAILLAFAVAFFTDWFQKGMGHYIIAYSCGAHMLFQVASYISVYMAIFSLFDGYKDKWVTYSLK